MYNPESLKEEIKRMESHADLFENKAKEIRDKIIEYKVWVKQLENNGQNNQKS